MMLSQVDCLVDAGRGKPGAISLRPPGRDADRSTELARSLSRGGQAVLSAVMTITTAPQD